MDILMEKERRNLHLWQNPECEDKSAEQTISLVLWVCTSSANLPY